MKKIMIYTLTLTFIVLLSTSGFAQIPHIVSGTVLNKDNSKPGANEIEFRGFLKKSPTDTSVAKLCSEGGGWGLDVIYEIPNSTWEVGDTLVVIFENVSTGPEAGSVTKLTHETTSTNPEFIGDYALPVEMTTFDALVQRDSFVEQVVLNWKTVGETNNYGFEVQKSTDGKKWGKIGFVAGAGSTNIARAYEFTDENVDVGTYHYRLIQIDTNGNSSTSDVKTLTVTPPKTYELSQNYPNPFNPQTNIIFQLKEDIDVKITVFDVLGREVASLVDRRMKAGTHTITFNGSQLSSGLYFYSMQAGDFHRVKKMAIVK